MFVFGVFQLDTYNKIAYFAGQKVCIKALLPTFNNLNQPYIIFFS